jgi:hypothetical protein
VKVFLGFLLVMFLLGGWEFRRGRSVKAAIALGMCLIAALALRSYRFV